MLQGFGIPRSSRSLSFLLRGGILHCARVRKMSSNKKTTTSKNKKNKTPNYSKSKQYKPRQFLSYDDTWRKMSKKNLECDRDNDDNDWVNPGKRDDMLGQK
ncbi:hypothetical protein F8M41_007711 [Gigaspora margarita]|uniref:Uncharacterized protein n=1 Tax=Gigaspora margarita TaxID=4874 RepID=A0A8H4A347_GIGMA|nr:hypothetical protein F8M41_007711 [Gigaspora margarita]